MKGSGIMNIIKVPINYQDVLQGYTITVGGSVYFTTKDGKEIDISNKRYESTNGYDFIKLMNRDMSFRLYPVDEILAYAFIPIPKEFEGMRITINHINGNTHDNSISNLEWIEDIEMWEDIDIPQISIQGYQISNFGRIMAPKNHIVDAPHEILIETSSRYKRIHLNINDNERKSFLIHRICAIKFGNLTNYDDELVVNHIDGNTKNNHWKNLEVVTHAQNNQHAFFAGLNSSVISEYNYTTIRDLLIYYNGSIVKVLRDPMVSDMGLTESILQHFKRQLIENEHISFDICHKKKITPSIFEEIRDLLIRTNGDSNEVLEILQSKYPELNIHNIKSVKVKLSKNGIAFKNMKYNIKISEAQRKELLNLLENNNWSPSKTFKHINQIKEYKNVSIYDLRYLKRKYYCQ